MCYPYDPEDSVEKIRRPKYQEAKEICPKCGYGDFEISDNNKDNIVCMCCGSELKSTDVKRR